jgi:hypothetical protein
MSELRTEVKTVRHNEAVAEKAEIITLQKELDALNQQTREDIEGLRNDVTIEMNNRKIATRAEQQTMVVKIQDLNYNFTKRLADMRTEIEAQKWQTTRALIGFTHSHFGFNESSDDYLADNLRFWTSSIHPLSEEGNVEWRCPDRLDIGASNQTRSS